MLFSTIVFSQEQQKPSPHLRVEMFGKTAVVTPDVDYNFKQDFKVYLRSHRKPGKWLCYTASLTAGTIWGLREAFYADPLYFEKKFGVNEYSFFGSKQWERKYVGNRYWNADFNRPNKMKSQLLGNANNDFWHASKYAVFTLQGTVIYTIASSKQSMGHKLADLFINCVLFSAASNIALHTR